MRSSSGPQRASRSLLWQAADFRGCRVTPQPGRDTSRSNSGRASQSRGVRPTARPRTRSRGSGASLLGVARPRARRSHASSLRAATKDDVQVAVRSGLGTNGRIPSSLCDQCAGRRHAAEPRELRSGHLARCKKVASHQLKAALSIRERGGPAHRPWSGTPQSTWSCRASPWSRCWSCTPRSRRRSLLRPRRSADDARQSRARSPTTARRSGSDG